MIFKKSQIFTFDVILAFIILLIALSVSFSYYVNIQSNSDIYVLSNSILAGFTNTKINSLNDKEIRMMFTENKITNIGNTVAQQVVEFYEDGEISDAQNLTRVFIEDYVDKQLNFNITLQNSTHNFSLYSKVNRPDVSYDEAIVASRIERTIFGFKESTNFYGPYTLVIKVWK